MCKISVKNLHALLTYEEKLQGFTFYTHPVYAEKELQPLEPRISIADKTPTFYSRKLLAGDVYHRFRLDHRSSVFRSYADLAPPPEFPQ